MNTRDIGLAHSAGKGDKPRHKLDDAWRANYDEINWGLHPPKSHNGIEGESSDPRIDLSWHCNTIINPL